MILDTVTKIEAVLAGAVSTNQPEYHVWYIDYNKDGQPTLKALSRGALNSASDVTILAAPPFNPSREVIAIDIYNKDTATVVVFVKTDDGATERILTRKSLTTLQTLTWTANAGWLVTS
jgi:hypothetical protein